MGKSTGKDSTWTNCEGPQGPDAVRAEDHLFLVLSPDQPLAPSARFSLGEVACVELGRGERGAERVHESGVPCLQLCLPDRWISSRHARLEKVLDGWLLVDTESKNGTLLNGAPVGRAALSDGDLFEIGHTLFRFRTALPSSPQAPPWIDAPQDPRLSGLTTLLPSLAWSFGRLQDVAQSPVSVVLRGESGTGKEVLARAVHQLSGRTGSFVAVNCGALPDALVESELFGHRRGAFSGAVEDRPGLVRSADRGTLFLDEIGDLPAASQAALLRVLQEGEVQPLGANHPIKVDLRVIAATHRDLDALVAAGDFRADLYARIAGYTAALPPLRERREDLGLLVAALLPRVAPGREATVRFTVEAARALLAYDWPLNVRELEKCLAAAVALAGGGPIGLEHLPPGVQAAPAARAPSSDTDHEDQQRRAELVALLREHRGNLSAVARAMGKARLQIQRWVKRYHLDPESFRRSP
ncbi:MAG TPA: sigma 54-interacting transcriptional regulator [Polyangia bacterium]|nr:sigma 54-interacting transcriptional regulator [Polyangia bacterium]